MYKRQGDVVVADVDQLRLIEALLFASAEPLTVNAIRERLSLIHISEPTRPY